MNPLLSILRATHCRSTHHYFAVDALPLVQTSAGKRLVSQLLRHHDRYLAGAQDPDVRFCDFQNHVIHVTDGYWGGAPRVAHKWYDRMQRYLREERFDDAAHAAGVLCHYFTDPLQPLHTQNCDRERILHRPIEWSINRSYKSIYRDWKQDHHRVVFQLSDGPGWLGEAILHGARFANRKYEQLLAEYDLIGALDQPRAGLNAHLRASLSEVIGLAVTGWARVLERAGADAEATRRRPLPTAPLPLATLVATGFIPLQLWRRRLTRKREQRDVELLVQEFTETGTLQTHLPVEVDIVHRVIKIYHEEQRWNEERERRLASRATVIQVDSVDVSQEETVDVTQPLSSVAESNPADDDAVILPFDPSLAKTNDDDSLRQTRAIGANSANRLIELGITTVGQLIAADPQDVAARLQTYWITSETISRWQAQVKLSYQLVDLEPREVQLLAGAGFATAMEIAAADPDQLHGEVSAFASTPDGRRCISGTSMPRRIEVNRWIAMARESVTSIPRRRSA